MKLEDIVKELNHELNDIEKDEKIGKIAAYINESWEQKANFMQYLLDKYSPKDTGIERKNPLRKYLYGAAAITAGSAAISYAVLRIAPAEDALSTFFVGYISLLAAIEIGKRKNVGVVNNSLDYAIKNGNFRQDLLDFYKNLKN